RPRRIALLDDDVIARKLERVARQLQRDTVIAAEAEFRRGIELPLGDIGREFDVARGQHIARHRDDGGARGDLAGRRLHRNIAPAPSDAIGGALAPSTNSAVPAQSPRSFGKAEAQDTSALPREASSMARLARTKAARNSSVSPARALRRTIRIFWPIGPADMSSPALRASRIMGLVSGLCIQRAPRSNGVSKVTVS